MESKGKGLTTKQENYCQEFVIHGNKTAAYKKAYNSENMKPSTINQKACLLAKQDNVKARITQLEEEKRERNRVTVDDLVQDLVSMIRADTSQMFNDDGTLKSIHDIPKELRMLISSVESGEEWTIDSKGNKTKKSGKVSKIRLFSKLDLYEKLMKHLGGYEKDKPIVQPNVNQVTIYQLPDNGRD